MATDGTKLRIALGNTPSTAALKRGALASPRCAIEIAAMNVEAIRRMVADQAFDACEMPIVTFLLARQHGHPLALLPATVAGRFVHGELVRDARRIDVTPATLNAGRIGLRSWAKTGCVWLRGILAADHGLDPARVRWFSAEDGHVAGSPDPTTRIAAGRSLKAMLLAGELDALLGESASDGDLATVFADPDAAARDWHRRSGIVPINHMIVVRRALIDSDPSLVAELYALLRRSDAMAPASLASRFGIEANRPALAAIIAHARRQELLAAACDVDALFADMRGLI
jgi:4,5-dihydroxyphthalate decarboxylase